MIVPEQIAVFAPIFILFPVEKSDHEKILQANLNLGGLLKPYGCHYGK